MMFMNVPSWEHEVLSSVDVSNAPRLYFKDSNVLCSADVTVVVERLT